VCVFHSVHVHMCACVCARVTVVEWSVGAALLFKCGDLCPESGVLSVDTCQSLCLPHQ